MGYFSQRAIITKNCYSRSDSCDLPDTDPLRLYLDILHEKLDELIDVSPHAPKHPGYDRCFYEDHIPELYEMPTTIQGVLWAIQITEREIERQKSREVERQKLMASVLNSGETPDGQIVIIGIFLPIAERV